MNKTFNDLKVGDTLYIVVTDLPKLSVAETKIINIGYECSFVTPQHYF